MRLSRPADQEAVDLEKADLADPVLYGEGDPHAVWRAMRERDPVHWQQGHDGLGFWSVTTYDDVSRVLRDYTDFTSEHGTLLNLLGKEDPASRRQLPATDPPRHTRMRSPIQRALNSRIIETHSEYIREEVRGLLDTVQDGVPFDFAELTGQLPMAITGTLMGLDRADWPRLTYLTSQAIAPDDPEFITAEGGEATLHRAHRELLASFQDAMSRRLERGLQEDGDGGDLIDLLLTMKLEDGRRMGAGEIVSNCYSLLLGANVTTPHVPNAVLLELTDDEAYGDWSARPQLLDSGIEEALRWSSPASHFVRYAQRDVQLGNVTIRAGEPVAAWLGSANRDRTAFPDPYRFDIRRTPERRNLAFGVGPHYCVGHAVARVSLRIFFQEMFEQFESFVLTGEPSHLHSNFIAGMKHLPVSAVRRPR
jgi:cytochrome P450